MSGVIVIAMYKANRNKEAAFDRLIEAHIPILTEAGLITQRP